MSEQGPALEPPDCRRKSKSELNQGDCDNAQPRVEYAKRESYRIKRLREYDADVLTATRALSEYYEVVAEVSGDPKIVTGTLSGLAR